jgi:hypothetical protein
MKLCVAVLAVLLCSLAAAQPTAELDKATMSVLFERATRSTCRLVIEGGDNITEITLYSTSVALMQLACTGAVLKVAVHPMLAPFVPQFTGVDVAPIPSPLQLLQGQGQQRSNGSICASSLDMLLLLCKSAVVTFVHPWIANVPQRGSVLTAAKQKEALQYGLGAATLISTGTDTVVSLIDPMFERIMMQNLLVNSFGVLLVKRGILKHSMWGLVCLLLMVFDGMRFTNNTAVMLGAAVTVMSGHAHFSECRFDSNRAPNMDETTWGH